jgi:hypothetical protein
MRADIIGEPPAGDVLSAGARGVITIELNFDRA